ncbi:MAG: MBL fold metallo-hydrolase [Planctomycetes bacterium]|nr:MBL fold metallo-hydrolase [Planctomycetota bacterium]
MLLHLNCGLLHVPPGPQAACHCLLVELESGRLALVDTGIGLEDIARPRERIGQAAIDGAGFQFHERLTARRQIERLGYAAADVSDIVLTHGDPDHAGGLADFPAARVHVSTEEHTQITAGGPRYSAAQFAHGSRWETYGPSPRRWFGLEARAIPALAACEGMLVPLFGHTHGHCGVALRDGERWLLHVGDAYYLRAELTDDNHPVSALAQLRAEDDQERRATLTHLRRLAQHHAEEVNLTGYHDLTEFPPDTLSEGSVQ